MVTLIFGVLADLVMFVLGIVVTFWPPKGVGKKRRYLGAFVVLCIFSLSLKAYESYQEVGASEQLQQSVRRTEQQTRQPPQVTVNVPAPVVQFLERPGTSRASSQPPFKPYDDRGERVPLKVLADEMELAHVQGLDYLKALDGMAFTDPSVADARVIEGGFTVWATAMMEAFSRAGCWASAQIVNSDVGLALQPNERIPEGNRNLYYNIQVRVYRIEQLMQKLQQTPGACP